MGGCSATLTSSSVVDGRPDRPSRGRWRIVSDVCRECSLKSIHCSKVHDSYLSRTPRPDKFTRPSVRTRRGNHPAPSGRPPRGGAKVTWFRYSCEYRRYSRDDPGDLTICHWAGGELTARQAAEPPSRRAAECASARKSSPPRPHRPQGQFETHPAKWHVHTPPCSAFHLLSSPTLHTLGHLQWRQPPSFVGSSGAAWLGSERHRHPRDPTTRPLRRSPRNP